MRTALVVLMRFAGYGVGRCVVPPSSPRKRRSSSTDNVTEQTGFKPNDMKCPSGVDAEVGKEFECHFTEPDGKKYTAHMKVTKVEGTVVGFNIQIRPS